MSLEHSPASHFKRYSMEGSLFVGVGAFIRAAATCAFGYQHQPIRLLLRSRRALAHQESAVQAGECYPWWVAP